MILKIIDRKIRESFSDAALQYDVLSSLHKEIGRELSRKVIDNDRVENILDIGMGTGWLTNRLSFFLPESQIIGLDFASGMVQCAKSKWEGINFVQGHACQLPFKNGSIDIIVSNLAYQWIYQLEQAFIGNYNVLNENGKFYLTLFGLNTFKELFDSLEKTKKGGQGDQIFFRRLPSLEFVRQSAVRAGFKETICDYEIIKVHFPDLLGLVKWSKNIGANVLNNDLQVGKQWLERAGQYYDSQYKDRFGVTATFEVIWLECHK